MKYMKPVFMCDPTGYKMDEAPPPPPKRLRRAVFPNYLQISKTEPLLYTTVMRTKPLMLFEEMIAVYSENHTQHICNVLCGLN